MEPGMSQPGLITIPSQHSVKETIDRLEAGVRERGTTVFARIDHAAGAAEGGGGGPPPPTQKIAKPPPPPPPPPAELLIFGNAEAGTPPMRARQTIGIDLPLKALAWEDEAGQVRLSSNDPTWLAARHSLGPEADAAVAALAGVLVKLTQRAASA